ncbi:MAG: hypothetical protein HYU99_06205 [Deltaproteobacteria bacterium]|nr:hypothetical protein [Deltaproteobacteria bacterium]
MSIDPIRSSGNQTPAGFPLDEDGRPDIPRFAEDLFKTLGAVGFSGFSGPSLQVGNWFTRWLQFLAPFRDLFGGSNERLHNLEVRRLTQSDSDRIRIAQVLVDRALAAFGMDHLDAASGTGPAGVKPFSFQEFSPQDLTWEDLKNGGTRPRDATTPITGKTSIKELRELKERGEYRLSANLMGLLETYPPEITLEQVADDLRRITVTQVTADNPQQNTGYRFRLILPEGREVRGYLESALRQLYREGKINEAYFREASAVLEKSRDAKDGLLFIFKNQPAWLVGTGLAGSTASAAVAAALEGQMNVFMPGLNKADDETLSPLAASKTAAALAYRRLALKTPDAKPGRRGPIHVYAGKTFVGEADIFQPERVVATINALPLEGARAIFAELADFADGDRQLEAVIAGHAVIRALRKKLHGTFRLLSPFQLAVEILSPNGTAKTGRRFIDATNRAMGFSFTLAEWFRILEAEVEEKSGLKVTAPIAFLNGRRLRPEMKALLGRLGLAWARDPAINGLYGMISLIFGQLSPVNPKTDWRHVSFDGGVTAHWSALKGILNLDNVDLREEAPPPKVDVPPAKPKPGRRSIDWKPSLFLLPVLAGEPVTSREYGGSQIVDRSSLQTAGGQAQIAATGWGLGAMSPMAGLGLDGYSSSLPALSAAALTAGAAFAGGMATPSMVAGTVLPVPALAV